jgi:hypothetical protein
MVPLGVDRFKAKADTRADTATQLDQGRFGLAVNAQNQANTIASERLALDKRSAQIAEERARREALQGGGLSVQDEKFINEMRGGLGDNNASLGAIKHYARSLDALGNTGVGMDAGYRAITSDQDSSPVRKAASGLAGWLTPNSVAPQKKREDFKTANKLQLEMLARKQMEQKGVQTAADTALYKASQANTGASPRTNAEILGAAALESALNRGRPGFYTRWAATHGSLNARGNGMTVDDAWNRVLDDAKGRYNELPAVKRLRANPAQQKKSRGWTVEEVK